MIANKHIAKIVAVMMTFAVVLCLGAVAFSEKLEAAFGGAGIRMEYETKLFDTSEIMHVNIIMEDAEWNDMLANALAKQYYECDVEINGKRFYSVGIRPKGTTSLAGIIDDPDNNRYSMKLEFDHYIDDQTCFGLDKLVLNSNFADATNMKEALIYDIFQYFGVDASLYNFAEISVNGVYWGVYLALEAVEESFMLRNYGADYGELYKPDAFNSKKIGSAFESMEGTGGADLNYIDDNLDSYPAIWNTEITKTTESDRKRVTTALKHIAEGTELERYMDIDNLLKLIAVHVFSSNSDSLMGLSQHNYYLYESKGTLNVLPWDYNLCLGGNYGVGGDATFLINDPIDEEFVVTDFFDALFTEEAYHSQYHAYLQQLADEYLFGDGFAQFYSRTRLQIDELMKNDSNAQYTYEEYEKALDVLCEVVKLRGQSINGQLAGTIPSGNRYSMDSVFIDASHIDLSVMGNMFLDGDVELIDSVENSNKTEASMAEEEQNNMSQELEVTQLGEMVMSENRLNGDEKETSSQIEMQKVSEYGVYFAVLLVGLFYAILFRRKTY